MIGNAGRSLRSQRRMCKPSASPWGKSSNNRSGGPPDWTRSIASQTFPTISSCQELDSPSDQSVRTRIESRLTNSSLAASVKFRTEGCIMWQKCRKEFEDAPQHKKADEDRMKLGQLGLTTWS